MSTGLKRALFGTLFLAALVLGSVPTAVESDFDRIEYQLPLGVIVVNSNSILQAKSPGIAGMAKKRLDSRFLLYITAYSSSEDETDSTPNVTASGTKTRDGVVASNFFPMGTRLKVPEIFGDRILTVEDRMDERFANRVDVWMPSKFQALQFGKKRAEVHVVEL